MMRRPTRRSEGGSGDVSCLEKEEVRGAKSTIRRGSLIV